MTGVKGERNRDSQMERWWETGECDTDCVEDNETQWQPGPRYALGLFAKQ